MRAIIMQPESRILILTIIFLLLDCSVGCTGSKVPSKSGTTTTVILIRHAERDNFFNITAQGRMRAKALVDVVKDMGITAIYSPNLKRNLDTVTPLASHLGLDITLTPKIKKALVDKIILEILSKHTVILFMLIAVCVFCVVVLPLIFPPIWL